jgi:hypothetical protein
MPKRDRDWTRPRDRDEERSAVAEQLADMAVEALREPLANGIDRLVKLGGELKRRVVDAVTGRKA